VLIAVGVRLETMKQIDSQLMHAQLRGLPEVNLAGRHRRAVHA
jgi:preprotein translocase subunit SecY